VYVCICHAVTEQEVQAHILDGARTEGEVGRRCSAGTRCGSCLDRICDMIDDVTVERATASA
jgi:bacterioferritin-associated ferredoxin